MRVLAIDTAGPVVGAARSGPEGTLVWSARLTQGADGQLLPALAALLGVGEGPSLGEWSGTGAPGPVDLVAVSVGPGAFTGLRVGVAAALGVALARGLKVVPLSSLAARAAMVSGARVLAVLDAKKSRVYAGLFDTSAWPPVALSPEVDLDPAEVWPEAPFLAVGEGAVVHSAAMEAAGGALVEGAEAPPVAVMTRLAAEGAAEALDPGEIALRYLRAADAKVPASLGGPR